MEVSIDMVRTFLRGLQDQICTALVAEDGEAEFVSSEREGEHGTVARPRVMSDGATFERAAVNFTHSRGFELPESATTRRPEVAGRAFEAVSLSLICHPRNPYVPTTHANFRCFATREKPSVWWFGGGYDLTPFYGFEEDAIHWHTVARSACSRCGEELYPQLKRNCDEYFFLPHRNEARGIGGVFYDDWDTPDFAGAFELTRSIAESFLPAYLPIVRRRKELPYADRERSFQKIRRGRYVEFNLIYDRGTRFGLQAGARAESVLASLPPEVAWRYDWSPSPGSAEELLSAFLKAPRLGLIFARGGTRRAREVG